MDFDGTADDFVRQLVKSHMPLKFLFVSFVPSW